MRKLTADEIECRVATVTKNGCSLLLYKDARVDMNLLDEEYGPMGWKRRHEMIGDNLYCIISVWDKNKQEWVDKEDVGTESYTEKEKGQASDSFKRAGFNWGIGRELYTAPFIWVSAQEVKIEEGKNGKLTTYDRFSVKDIGYDGDRINRLEIVNEKSHKTVYTLGKLTPAEAKVEKAEEQPKAEAIPKYTPVLEPKQEDAQKKATIGQTSQLRKICKERDVPEDYIAGLYGKEKIDDLTRVQSYTAVNSWSKFEDKYKETLEGIPFK